MRRWIEIISTILIIFGMIIGVAAWFDARYAKAADQQADHQLLRDKLDSDHLRLLRERKWQMEKEFPAEARRPETVDRQIKDYSIQEKALEQKLGGREVQ